MSENLSIAQMALREQYHADFLDRLQLLERMHQEMFSDNDFLFHIDRREAIGKRHAISEKVEAIGQAIADLYQEAGAYDFNTTE